MDGRDVTPLRCSARRPVGRIPDRPRRRHRGVHLHADELGGGRGGLPRPHRRVERVAARVQRAGRTVARHPVDRHHDADRGERCHTGVRRSRRTARAWTSRHGDQPDERTRHPRGGPPGRRRLAARNGRLCRRDAGGRCDVRGGAALRPAGHGRAERHAHGDQDRWPRHHERHRGAAHRRGHARSRGSPGRHGTPGAAGPKGAQGPMGPQGPIGDTGPSGAPAGSA
jgi:hypothetical protein